MICNYRYKKAQAVSLFTYIHVLSNAIYSTGYIYMHQTYTCFDIAFIYNIGMCMHMGLCFCNNCSHEIKLYQPIKQVSQLPVSL